MGGNLEGTTPCRVILLERILNEVGLFLLFSLLPVQGSRTPRMPEEKNITDKVHNLYMHGGQHGRTRWSLEVVMRAREEIIKQRHWLKGSLQACA